VNIHHFEETIGGRAYQIEVTSAGGRWRAQLRRRPGALTAMMPFYAETPEEASRMLTQWLTLAHERQLARTASATSPIGPTAV
jgi:predicted RNase H-like HicB family nuclease